MGPNRRAQDRERAAAEEAWRRAKGPRWAGVIYVTRASSRLCQH